MGLSVKTRHIALFLIKEADIVSSETEQTVPDTYLYKCMYIYMHIVCLLVCNKIQRSVILIYKSKCRF